MKAVVVENHDTVDNVALKDVLTKRAAGTRFSRYALRQRSQI